MPAFIIIGILALLAAKLAGWLGIILAVAGAGVVVLLVWKGQKIWKALQQSSKAFDEFKPQLANAGLDYKTHFRQFIDSAQDEEIDRARS
jgi:hypothetical protein